MTARRFKFDIRQAGNRILAVLLVLLAFNLAFYLLATRPKVREYSGMTVDNAPRLQELERRKRAVEAREGYLDDLRKAKSDLRLLREEVLSTRGQRMVEVQKELEALCGRFGINIDSVTLEHDLLQSENLDKMIMVVPLQGNYANLRNFLQAVESSEKFLLVERVALAEGKQGGVLLELNITLATYFDAPHENGGRKA